jgi:hypothetical protein
MEHVDGLSLDVLLKERPNSAQRILPGCKDPSEPVALLSKLAEAVRAVHRADVVHKDLKPANIMMTEEGGVWEPKVIDFGLAAPEMPDGRSGNTHSIWTWRYLAPEKKSDEDATRRRPADIYSLGVVFLEILVGLSKMDPSKLLESKRAALAPKMVVLLQAMLSIEPDDRPTIDEVVGRLQGVLEPEDWRQAGERADEEYSEERFDQALMFYHRALAEAPPGERRTSGFAALLPNVLDCITDATEVPGWWRLLARVSVNAREHLGQSYWEDLFKEAKGAPDGKTEGVSPLGEVLEVLEDTIPQWDKAAEPMALGLATVSLPVRESELLYQLLLAARDCEAVDPVAVADFCGRQARRHREYRSPLPLVENWLRRGRRLAPIGSALLDAEQKAFEQLQKTSHSAAALPPDAIEQDVAAVGKKERGHVLAARVQAFANKVLRTYSWVQGVRRVRGDSKLPHARPTLLDDSARHLIDGLPTERIIPFALDGSYTAFNGCLRMNIVLPEGTTTAQRAAARTVLARNKRLFP